MKKSNPVIEYFDHSKESEAGFVDWIKSGRSETRLLLFMPEREEAAFYTGKGQEDKKGCEGILELLFDTAGIRLQWVRKEDELKNTAGKSEWDKMLAVGTGEILQSAYKLSLRLTDGKLPVMGVLSDAGWKGLLSGRLLERQAGRCCFRGRRRLREDDKIYWREPDCRCRQGILFREMALRLAEAEQVGCFCARDPYSENMKEKLYEGAVLCRSTGNGIIYGLHEFQKEDGRMLSEWENKLLGMAEGSARLLAAPLEIWYGMPWEWAIYYALCYLEGIGFSMRCGLFSDTGSEWLEKLRENIIREACFLPDRFWIAIEDIEILSDIARESRRESPASFLLKESEIADFYRWLQYQP